MMAPNYQSTTNAGITKSHMRPNVNATPDFPGTLPPSGIAPFPAPAPAQLFTEHHPESIGRDSLTPPPPYTESMLRLINGDAKTPPHACNDSPPLLPYLPKLDSQHAGALLCIGPSEKASSIRRLCGPYIDDDSAGFHPQSPTQRRIPFYCATCTLASNHLNYHVGLNAYAYRWRTTEGPIPIGIHFSSFESNKQRSLVKKCLKVVLQKLNDNLKPVGPQFRFVKHHSSSAFVVTFEGEDSHCYASAFFPDSNPKGWYINVYRPGLTLCGEQKQCIKRKRREDTKRAQIQALEQNLINILTHEMLHIVGIRHCDIDEDVEKAPYVRFPIHLSDEDNRDSLMRPGLRWEDLSEFDLKPQTVEEIRQIYAKKEGDSIGPYIIKDISWRSGAKHRKKWLKSMRT